jgi:hypothetical protein
MSVGHHHSSHQHRIPVIALKSIIRAIGVHLINQPRFPPIIVIMVSDEVRMND